MSKILVRSAQDPFEVLNPEKATRSMGGNSGNLLYAHSVHRALSTSDAEIKAGGFTAHTLDDPTEWINKINRKFDRFVVPMSNAFRFGFSQQLVKLTEIVRRLDMPVTVIGVGAQAPADEPSEGGFAMGKTGSSWAPSPEEAERHNKNVFDFATAVLEKSTSLGVRGAFTKRYLESLGVPGDRVDVIGCPSLYTWGPGLRVDKKFRPITRRSRISVNVDHRVAGMGAVVERNAELYPRLTSPVQDSLSARTIIRGENQHPEGKFDPRTPIHTEHPLYTSKRMVYYPNPWGWIESFKEQRFAFGSRLHGNIAALLAGTPAHLLAHDSRTVELAEYHRIPHTRISELETPPTAAELYWKSSFREFNELMPVRFQVYLDFLHRNALTTVFDEGQSAADFDAQIVAGQQVGPVLPR
ncbi:polysaccharide pyruvyl transferase family protein [Modestobacter altitudinis]|uniref:polysaccharide pyruvyl transferase family protein n=1 Tax=Modestobacter altitudinis TaxID=2213158 RepID=UPI00110D13D4|nr:polysaccharide pyruvyl transferase family protein [Modestobacter altitudinis]